MTKVAFLGLGVMGYPMAGHLQSSGHDVTVYNRTAAKADKWMAEHGGVKADTPADAANGCDFVFACVGDDKDIASVTTGPDGAFQTMPADAVFIDNTTASADIARVLYDAARAKGLHFIDAPVSGGQAGAEGGKLTVMCGGDAKAMTELNLDVMLWSTGDPYGVSRVSQLTKMVNQICIAGLVQGLSEALNLVRMQGWIWIKCWGLSLAVQPSHGRWKTGVLLWLEMNLILALRLTGCARICGFVWLKQLTMELSFR